MIYSGFFRRFVAFAIDTFVLVAGYLAAGLILSLFSGPLLLLPMLGFWFYGGLFSFAWIYFAAFESSKKNATIGQQMLGLKVVNLDGHKIGFWRATLRYFIRTFFRIGAIFILFTKRKQALYDLITRVVVTHN